MAASIRDVAKKSGVSICTVSYVLNNKKKVKPDTRDRVLAAIRELKYDPYRHIPLARQTETKSLGIILPLDVFSLNTFYHRAIAAIKRITTKKGYDCLIYSEEDIRNKLDNDIHKGRRNIACSGLLVFCSNGGWDSYISVLRSWDIPVALIRRTTRVPGITTVHDDDYKGGLLAMEHLLQLGHTRIACAGWNMDSGYAKGRLDAYRDCIRKYGLVQDERLEIDWGKVPVSPEEQVACLMKTDVRPTAFCCDNDHLAMRIINELKDLGIEVPREVSVIGYNDDVTPEFLNYKLTTVRTPVEEMVRMGCRALFDAAEEGASGGMDIVCENTLVERESCGKHVDMSDGK